MSKYYRVRTKAQFDWLFNQFEQSETLWYEKGMNFREVTECLENGGSVIVHDDFLPDVGPAFYTAVPPKNEDVIDVVLPMEENKMEDYVEIEGEDLKKIEMFRGNESKGNLREFWDVSKVNIPKSLLYPKVPMSVAEKREFDEFVKRCSKKDDVDDVLSNTQSYDLLFEKIFNVPNAFQKQFDFIRAFADPSLIEVVEEPKYNVEVPETGGLLFYVKNGEHCGVGKKSENNLPDQQFTEKEIEQHSLTKYRRAKAPK